jgi:2-hydroxychromene-2-carboxylate isomerase
MPAEAVFCFDVGSPYAWLAAERVETALPVAPEWQPVLLGGLFRLAGRSSWARGDERRRAAGMAEIERRAAVRGLPPVRWPEPWPGDMLTAMRAATWAATRGRSREFALAATRRAFGEGRDLSREEEVLAAAAAAGLDAGETAAGVRDPAVKAALRAATEAAHARGVTGVPTVVVGARAFWGDDHLEAAARALA